MAELGCELLLVCSNVSPQSARRHRPGRRRPSCAGRDARAQRGMRVGFEALAWGRHISDYRDAWEVVRRADHPAIGLVLDSFHIFARKTDLKPISSIPARPIFLVQLADAPLLDMDSLSWSRHFRSFPGQGELPLIDFMTALQATDFDGLLVARNLQRSVPRRLGAQRRDRRAAFAARSCSTNCASAAALAGRTRPATAAREVPRHRVHRVRDRRERGAGLRDAAARHRLRHAPALHKSKAVTRWTQGAINIVVNAEKDGFAHSFNITHGTGVCAIGLAVDDAAATLARAEGLLDKPFRQAVGPGELEIPAVRGLGGSLVYFVDKASDLGRVWEIEFKPTGETNHDAGLRVDRPHLPVDALRGDAHLGAVLHLAARAQEDRGAGRARSRRARAAARWSSRRTARCGSRSTPRSRRAPSRHAFSPRRSARACSTSPSPPADLAATVARLEANGVDLLPIPENYYDDLEAKTDLAPERIDELRAHNILYDRDGGGEYLQVYTRTFASGSSSRSSSAAATQVSAPPTHRSGSPRRARLARGRMAPMEL